MARKLRVEYPGAIYHVMNRGDRREPIFKDDQDRIRFIATLGGDLREGRVGSPRLLPDEQSFHHGGMERQETAEQRASRVLSEEFRRRGWDKAELKRRKKRDQTKAGIAQRLRRETTATWEWIARGLLMGASGYAANCVRSIVSGA